MLTMLSRYWWLVVLRGVFAILFGVLAFIWPGITIGALVILFGAYALIDGVSSVATGVMHRQDNDRWWVMLLEGIAGIVFGILTFVWPAVTAVVLLVFIAVWAIITGVLELVAAVRLRKEIDGEWALGLAGVLSVLFGVVMLLRPGAGALALIWVIGSYAIVFGVLLIFLGFKLRGVTSNAVSSSAV